MKILRHPESLTSVQQGEQEQPAPITNAQLVRLPEPMQRYLRYAGVVGREPISTVRLKQQGVMRQQPDQRWIPLVAEQYFTMRPPTFLWQAIMRPFPLLWISATDYFMGGHGSMAIKLLSYIPIGKEDGPNMDQSELQRYLGEIIWFPTAWLSSDINWQSIDTSKVQATLGESGVIASMVLHMNEQGQVTRLSTERYRGQHGPLLPWSVQLSDYQNVNGMYIPISIEVSWHLTTGEFTWLRLKITDIEYNPPGL